MNALEFLKTRLTELDLGGFQAAVVAYAATVAAVIAVSFVVNFAAKKLLLRGLHAMLRRSKNRFDDALIEHHVFARLAHLAPAVVIYLSASLFGAASASIRNLAFAYMAVVVVLAFDAFINVLLQMYESLEISRRKPLRGYAQVAKIFLYAVAAILVIAHLIDRSPWGLLSGIGALSAVLLLVFRDSILGLVSGIQLSANNMVRIGDWIEMPKYSADGDVFEISLTTVKVRNWDKTISTIPTYALISDSFKNWRGMAEAGGRRIKRSLYIDMNSVGFLGRADAERLEKIQLIQPYLAQRRSQIEEYNRQWKPQDSPVNGRALTNVGTFRAYVSAYLHRHPKINQDMTLLVRHLDPTDRGLPIQVYAFCRDIVWANYEGIQADIFDHLLAVLPEFGLRVFQMPSGRDVAEAVRSATSREAQK